MQRELGRKLLGLRVNLERIGIDHNLQEFPVGHHRSTRCIDYLSLLIAPFGCDYKVSIFDFD